jgi:hypothetical protein
MFQSLLHLKGMTSPGVSTAPPPPRKPTSPIALITHLFRTCHSSGLTGVTSPGVTAGPISPANLQAPGVPLPAGQVGGHVYVGSLGYCTAAVSNSGCQHARFQPASRPVAFKKTCL